MLVLKTAIPLATPTVASVVVPSVKVTVPVSVPAPGEVMLTVAVNVTLWPDKLGLPLPARAIVVLALLTVWGTMFDARLA